jgi:hypothetical protein
MEEAINILLVAQRSLGLAVGLDVARVDKWLVGTL